MTRSPRSPSSVNTTVPDEALALIARVTHTGARPMVPLRTPLPSDDVQALKEVQARNLERQSRQVGVNLLVEQILIADLEKATG